MAAGSEVRHQTNDSVDVMTRLRREELNNADVLAEIPSVADRRRLIVALSFPSTSAAALVFPNLLSARSLRRAAALRRIPNFVLTDECERPSEGGSFA